MTDLERAARALSDAEAAYRKAHDLYGDGSREAGFAWDRMRHAGDAIRAALSATDGATGGANDAAAMREACAAEVDRLAALGGTDEKQAICRFVARHLRRLPLPHATGDATRVPPAPVDAVERARRAFYEAAREECAAARADFGEGDYRGARRRNDADRALNRAYDALLAAETRGEGV